MNNYLMLLRKTIGANIRSARKAKHLSQPALMNMDTTILSRIENGNAVKKKNPYLINASQISYLSNKLGKSPGNLLWGNDGQKEGIAKMIVLSVLINGAENPFMNMDVADWIDKEWVANPHKGDEMKEHLDDAIKRYGYFVNKDNHVLYSFLEPGFDAKLERLSNIMLKKLVHDQTFTKYFFSRLTRFSVNSGAADTVEEVLKNYIVNKGSYGFIILDKNGGRYHTFISAFEKYWQKTRNEYLEYFDKTLFLSDDELTGKGIKKLSNDYIRDTVLLSGEFVEMTERMMMLAEYTDGEAIMSALHMRFSIIRDLVGDSPFEPLETVTGWNA